MDPFTVLLLVVILLCLFGGVPTYRAYGPTPGGLVGLVLVVLLLVLLLRGRL